MSRGCVEGCGFNSPHAGAHGEPYTPATAYCAPARCYCGSCPSWTPRVPVRPPIADPASPAIAAELAAARARLRDVERLSPAGARARDDRRRAARAARGLSTAGACRLTAA